MPTIVATGIQGIPFICFGSTVIRFMVSYESLGRGLAQDPL